MTRLLAPVLSALVLVGCATPEAPAQAPPAPPPQDAPAPSAPAASPPATPAGGLSPDLEACVPASVRELDADLAVTARADEAGTEVVLLEWHMPGQPTSRRAADFHPVLLRVDGDSCESLLPENTDSFSLAAEVSEPVLRELMRENSAWKAEQVGGTETYADILRGTYSDPLTACRADGLSDGGCLDDARARALREIGISVVDPAR